MINELWIAVAAASGAFLTKFIEWVFNKKSQREEVREKEIKNEIQLSEYYKTMLDDLSKRYENKYIEIVALYDSKEKILREETSLLRRENRILKQQIKEKESEIKAQRIRIAQLELKLT